MKAEDVIGILNLQPLLPEGGYFRETYRSAEMVTSEKLGKKTESTAIYYLITADTFSALHTVDQDEIFHFYAGSPVRMLQIREGKPHYIDIGSDLLNGQVPQVIVPRGIWQGTKLATPDKDAWALLGCTVAPGFEYSNFYIENRDVLQKKFPLAAKEISDYAER